MDGCAVECDAVLGVHLWLVVQWSMKQSWAFTCVCWCCGAWCSVKSSHVDGLTVEPIAALVFYLCVQHAMERGALVVKEPWEESDENGTVRMARIQTYGDTTHTLIDRSNYKGPFLPGYKPTTYLNPLTKLL